MSRRGALTVALLLFGAARVEAGGVVVLRSSDIPAYTRTVEAFQRAYHDRVDLFSLTELDPNVAIERMRETNPEIVVAVGLKAAVLVRDRMPRVPMVYCMVPAPLRHDLVGSRITGVSADVPPALEMGLLHDLAPDVRRVGVIVGRHSEAWLREAQAAAEKLNVRLEVARIDSLPQLGPQLRMLVQVSDALWMPADADVATPEAFHFMMSQALEARLPFFTFAPGLVRAGALAAAAPDLDWVAARIVEAVRRVQSGERAGDVPSTDLRRVRLVANLTTARALGRDLPASVLKDAELVR